MADGLLCIVAGVQNKTVMHGAIKECGWSRFHGRLWQRNYYEHVIRNEDDLHKIREYIRWNPAKWALDSENPSTMRKRFDCESEMDIILRGDFLKE